MRVDCVSVNRSRLRDRPVYVLRATGLLTMGDVLPALATPELVETTSRI